MAIFALNLTKFLDISLSLGYDMSGKLIRTAKGSNGGQRINLRPVSRSRT